jgi:replicative DNA helicase
MIYDSSRRIEIEKYVIAYIFYYVDAVSKALELNLNESHFSVQEHKVLFKIALSLKDDNLDYIIPHVEDKVKLHFLKLTNDIKPLDLINDSKLLVYYLEQIIQMKVGTDIVSFENFVFKLKEYVLMDYWNSLELRNQNFSFELYPDIFEFSDNVINGYNNLFNDLTQGLKRKNHDNYDSELDQIVENYRNGITVYIPTGIKKYDLDYDGIYPTDLIIIAARPSMGKSLLLKALSLKLAIKEPGAYFTLEVSKSKVKSHLISALTSIDYNRIKKGNLTDNEIERIKIQSELLDKSNLQIFDPKDYVNQLEVMEKKIDELYNSGKLKWVLIDYLQLMKVKKHYGTRDLEIGAISGTLKQIAIKYNIPIIALSQLSREVEKRDIPIPKLSDLRESGNIEQDADDVYFLYRPGYYKKLANPGLEIPLEELFETILFVAKKREGALNDFKYIIDIHSLEIKS